jgi:PKD repeat protein
MTTSSPQAQTPAGGYTLARNYNVTLTVVDSNGQTGTVEQSVTIAEP